MPIDKRFSRGRISNFKTYMVFNKMGRDNGAHRQKVNDHDSPTTGFLIFKFQQFPHKPLRSPSTCGFFSWGYLKEKGAAL